ncbi:MAG: hypothetical protein Kow0040_25600 [Thermogutta sp.]
MAKDDMDIVSALRRAVADRVGRERFHLWFGENAQFLWDGVRVFVVVPNQFYLDWLRTRFRKHVDEGCTAVLGYTPPIDFRLKPPTKTDPRPSLFAQPDVLRANLRLDESHLSAEQGDGSNIAAVLAQSTTASELPSDAEAVISSAKCSSEALAVGSSRATDLNSISLAQGDAFSATLSADNGAIEAGCDAPVDRDSHAHQNGKARGSASGRQANELPLQPLLFPMDGDMYEPECGVSGRRGVGSKSSIEARDSTALTESLSRTGSGIAAPCENNHAGNHVRPSETSSRKSSGGRGRRFAGLRDFVVGPPNQLAFAAAETVIQHLGEYSPLTIYGPTGTGKTHLLEGVWSAVRQRHRHLPSLYLSAEQFTSAFIDAVKGGGVAALRMKYRGVRLLILDDLQFFRGKRQTQIELLYTIDALLKNGSQVICAADRSPQELGELGSELISRLQSGMVCRLDPPDAAMRMEIISRAAASVNLNLSEPVCRWLSQRLTGDVRQLTGAVCRLKAFAGTSGTPIGRKEAEEVLADLLPASSAEVPIEEIEQAICRTFGLPDKSLHADTKDRRISGPRMLAMWLARKYTRAPLNEIGRYFGKRSHATVISAQKRVDQWLAEDAELRADRRTWKVADVIEEVHRQLRVG